jgi:NADPH:quinone reductase-like Zn-dependent oxidoreductase
MKAVQIHTFGGPEVLKLEDVPTPEPGEGEILIRVNAASVNPVDYKMRRGGYPRAPKERLPITLGRDVAGKVDRCGPAVSGFEPGDAVYTVLPWDRGGYAEFVVVKAADCALKPARLQEAQAAAVPLAGLTAWQGLFDHGGLQEGQCVLIHGGAGGVGHLAVQFANAKGATVYATCSGQDLGFVEGLGAKRAIDYRSERFEDIVHEADVVLDLVAGETQERSWAVLREGGIIVSTLKPPSKDKAAEHRARGTNYLVASSGKELTKIAHLIDNGNVRPEIDRIYPLRAVAEAQQHIENEHVRGKVILHIA